MYYIYNMNGRFVSDIETRAEGKRLYVRYNTDANIGNVRIRRKS